MDPDPNQHIMNPLMNPSVVNSQTTQRILSDFVELSKKLIDFSQKIPSTYDPDYAKADKPFGPSEQNNLFENEFLVKPILDFKGISPLSSQMIIEKLQKKLNFLNFQPLDKTLNNALKGIIKKEVSSLLPTAGPLCLIEEKASYLVVLGPSGVGKTTFLLKIREQYAVELKKKVSILSWGFNQQNEKNFYKLLGKKWGITWQVANENQPLHTLLDLHKNYDLVLVDTPGFSLSNGYEIQTLASEIQDIENIQVQVVLNAEIKTEEALEKIRFFNLVRPLALVMTKLDEAAYLGSLIDLVQQSGLPISYVVHRNGQEIQLDIADPDKLAEEILNRS
jgi:flagellar biosynthesis protein FlhF